MNELIIPDLHAPYEHPDALDFLKSVKDWLKPDLVVSIGDEVDQHALSKYSPDPDADSAGTELGYAIDHLLPFYKLFPKVFVCESNHTWRVFKRAFEAGIPTKYMRDIGEVLEAPQGWQWRENWTLNRVYHFHGDGFSGNDCARKACERLRTKVVMGHIHSQGGVYHVRGISDSLYGLSVGSLIDEKAVAFKYAKHDSKKPVLGCGVIKDGVPQFIPMEGGK